MKKIFLYGPPGSGKSTIGKILAENLDFNFIDLDVQIEAAAGMVISQIINNSGEQTFREMETAAIEQVCGELFSGASGCVVALGGGALLRPENRARVESAGQVIFLDVDLPTLLSRLSPFESQRPLLAGDPKSKLIGLLEKRKEHYASFEYRVVMRQADNSYQIKTPENLVWEIQRDLGVYHVRGMGLGYDVVVEPGGLDKLGWMLKERGLNGPVVVVSDVNVAPFYAERVLKSIREAGLAAQVQLIQAGEEYKTLETVAGLWRSPSSKEWESSWPVGRSTSSPSASDSSCFSAARPGSWRG